MTDEKRKKLISEVIIGSKLNAIKMCRRKVDHKWVKVTGYFTHACAICNEKKREIKHPWGIDQKATVKKCPSCGLRMRTDNHQCPMKKEKKQ